VKARGKAGALGSGIAAHSERGILNIECHSLTLITHTYTQQRMCSEREHGRQGKAGGKRQVNSCAHLSRSRPMHNAQECTNTRNAGSEGSKESKGKRQGNSEGHGRE
jgi:hypothetical protein